jgi:hypothetical protein
MTTIKLRKAWTPKLESIRKPKVRSDEAREDVETILEAETCAIFFRLMQAPEHYKPPTFKAIIYIYVLYMYYCIML